MTKLTVWCSLKSWSTPLPGAGRALAGGNGLDFLANPEAAAELRICGLAGLAGRVFERNSGLLLRAGHPDHPVFRAGYVGDGSGRVVLRNRRVRQLLLRDAAQVQPNKMSARIAAHSSSSSIGD